MDYVSQIEQLIKYLELVINEENKIYLLSLKNIFNNDLNLFGCFIKDFLFVQKSDNFTEDDNIYHDFVLYFDSIETNSLKQKIFLKLYRYAKYYREIVFEETDDENLLYCTSTINSCCALYSYPYLMMIVDSYLNQKINGKTYSMMLKSIVDVVIEQSKNLDDNFITPLELKSKMKNIFLLDERLAS